MNCTTCDAKLPEGKKMCTECGAFNVTSPTVNGENDGTILLENVVSAEHDKINIKEWNYCWGGGLVRKSTTLLGGMPGAGKSTMLLQMCELFVKEIPTRETLYIAAEEDLDAIKMRADRLGIQGMGRMRMLPAIGGVANVSSILHTRKPGAVILDSLQGLFGDDAKDCEDALDVLKKFSSLLDSPVIIVSQVTKEGDYAGQMAFQHHVDTLMFLTPEEGEEGEEADRILSVRKNRNGPAFIESVFEMTERGLMIVDDE